MTICSSMGNIPLTMLLINDVLISNEGVRLSKTLEWTSTGKINQLDADHSFAPDVDKAIRGKLEIHVVDEADGVMQFYCKEGRADQIRFSTSIDNADRRS